MNLRNIQNRPFRICLLFLGLCLAHSSWAQKQYKIVYNVLEDKATGNYEIYSMNMDGSQPKKLTHTPGVEWAYYAYKDKVYFVSDADTCKRCYFLYEMDANGHQKRKVSELQLEDSYMGSNNRGRQLLVLGKTGKIGGPQLFLINLKDGSYKQISFDTLSSKRDPIILPGGKEMVLAYRPNKQLRKTVPEELWKMNLDGSNAVQLTFFPIADSSTKWYEYHAGPPQWNNRYGFISYMSRQNGQHQIFGVKPNVAISNKAAQWQITHGEMGSGWHSWSSDGQWLAMDKTNKAETSYDIYLMNYATGKTIQLTNGPVIEQAPVIVEIKKGR